MEKRNFKNFPVSHLVVGGVQFGSEYGIANRVGKPSYESVSEIVRSAFARGVNALDTAALYGDSEAVFGRVLSELGLKEKAFISSKVRFVKGYTDENPKAVHRYVRESVVTSLTHLGVDWLPLCSLHQIDDLPYVDALLALKEKGLVRHVGVSLYTPHDALRAIETPGIEAIQCPISVLDHRFMRAGILERAREKGIAIFARSIYLQGLLALPEDEIPSELEAVVAVRRSLQDAVEGLGISLMELGLRFVQSLETVTGIVVGMETVEQLESNLDFMEKGHLPERVVNQILSSVPELPKSILIPGRWPEPKVGE